MDSDFDKKKQFEMVMPGMFIMAKTPNYSSSDVSHLIRPFFVVGKGENKLYVLYMTSKDNGEYGYYKISNFSQDGYSYICLTNILEIDKESFLGIKYVPSEDVYHDIINNLSCYIVDPQKVYYRYADLPKHKGSIVYHRGKLYMYNKSYNGTYILYPLKVSNNKKGIYIDRKTYEVDSEKKVRMNCAVRLSVIKSDVLYNESKLSLKFGDIIVNNTGEKSIFIFESSNNVFTCSLDSLELFSGIGKQSSNNIKEKLGAITDDDRRRLALKIERYLDNNKMIYVDDSISSDLVKKYIKN